MTTNLGPLLQEFFHTHLRDQRQVSPNTIRSYRDTFKLLVEYLRSKHRPGRGLDARDLEPRTVLAFLQYLEERRHNTAVTRNQRLIAIKSFLNYAALLYPSLESIARRLQTLRAKRTHPKEADSLDRQELEALLEQLNLRSPDGFRDLTILLYLYNTGARAQEVADTRLGWFDFPNRLVTITGKGGRERTTPLWAPTVSLLTTYKDTYRRKPKPAAHDIFFVNQRGGAFTRFGIRDLVIKYLDLAAKKRPTIAAKRLSTHNLRHTTSAHLAESKVDPTGVKGWLGHARLRSTSRYFHTDLNQKRRILEQFGPPSYVDSAANPQPGGTPDKILNWLKEL